MTAGYALNWMLGTADMPHSRMQFDIGAQGFAFSPDDCPKDPMCACVRFNGFGDAAEKSVTLPSHFPRAIVSRLLSYPE
jgi:hypothetical protein